MRAYLITTGTVFALIILAHGARLWQEGPQLLKQPVFVLTSLLSLALLVWAWRLFRGLPRG